MCNVCGAPGRPRAVVAESLLNNTFMHSTVSELVLVLSYGILHTNGIIELSSNIMAEISSAQAGKRNTCRCPGAPQDVMCVRSSGRT